MKVISYKQLKLENIQLSIPEKDIIYKSNILLNNIKDWFIQTPEIHLISENTITFTMVKKGQFLTLLEDLYEKIVKLICLNSKQFFNGKIFTEKQIRNSFGKPYKLDDNGLVTLENIILSEKLTVYNNFNEKIDIPDFPIIGNSILSLGPITFVKNTINLNFNISFIKTTIIKKKILECILDDCEKNEADTDNDHLEQLIENKSNDQSNIEEYNDSDNEEIIEDKEEYDILEEDRNSCFFLE